MNNSQIFDIVERFVHLDGHNVAYLRNKMLGFSCHFGNVLWKF